MGKSFNNDIDFGLDITNAINGIPVSQEAQLENKKKETEKDLTKELKKQLKANNIDLKEIKETIKKKEKAKEENIDIEEQAEQLKQANERFRNEILNPNELEARRQKQLDDENKQINVKKTMLFKQEYLDIINGISIITNAQQKEVLNLLIKKGINALEQEGKIDIAKALKLGKKTNASNTIDDLF